MYTFKRNKKDSVLPGPNSLPYTARLKIFKKHSRLQTNIELVRRSVQNERQTNRRFFVTKIQRKVEVTQPIEKESQAERYNTFIYINSNMYIYVNIYLVTETQLLREFIRVFT